MGEPKPAGGPRISAEALGYSESDLWALAKRAGGRLEKPEDLRRVIDSFGYLAEWRENYQIQSVRSSLKSDRITCIDAAVLGYGLLEMLFPETKRALLAIHRRDPATDEECGHCVTLYWSADGKVGAFSKSNYAGLGHRDAAFADEAAVAASYAEAYLKMKITPLYFGVTTPEQAIPELDWRFSPDDLNLLSDRLKESYQYAFDF